MLRLSASKELVYLTCPRKYWYQYVAKAQPLFVSCNLAFGGAVHAAIERVLRALCFGIDLEPVDVFDDEFDRAFAGQSIQFTSTFRENDLRTTGRRLLGKFLSAWQSEGLTPLIDAQGPVLERSFTANLGDGLVVTGIIDVIALTRDGEVAVLDFKTPAQESFEHFELVSDQLTMYQLLVEQALNAQALGIERVDRLGFMELLKKKVPKSRGEGPVIRAVRWAPRRSVGDISEFTQKLRWTMRDIRNGRFPKTSMAAFNSPCTMCDYARACISGKCDDIHFATPQRVPQITAAA